MSEHTQTVLIIDDDDAVRESLMDYIEARSWRVASAAADLTELGGALHRQIRSVVKLPLHLSIFKSKLRTPESVFLPTNRR